MLSRLYAFIAWAIVGIGLLHMLTTFRLTTSATARVWFFGSGLAIALVGALNLLHRAYGDSALGLRGVCRSANAALLLFAVVAGTLTAASTAQQILLWSIIASAFVFSCLPPRFLPRR
jgi:hypothetical protein